MAVYLDFSLSAALYFDFFRLEKDIEKKLAVPTSLLSSPSSQSAHSDYRSGPLAG